MNNVHLVKQWLRNWVDVRLVNNKKLVNNNKQHLKWTSKPRYIKQKIFGNILVAICKIRTTLTFDKPAHVRMCIL